ncbi:IclR family transcriptional regulator [Vreelandella sp. GE22]
MEYKAKAFDIGHSTAGAQSVDRAMTLLSQIGRHAGEGASLSELTQYSGLNKPTTRRLLIALINAGMVEQSHSTQRYQLGPEAFLLGQRAAEQHNLTRLAGCSVSWLAQKTQDAACLSIRRGHLSLCLQREDGAYPIRTHALLQGSYHPLGIGAGSLAMLATLPDLEIQKVLEAQRPTLENDFSQLSVDQIQKLIRETRQQGYALNSGLIFPDSWGIGIALHWPDGVLVGSLSIAAIENRMQEPRRTQLLIPSLREAATAIETELAKDFFEYKKF